MKRILLFMPYGSVGGMERLAAYQYEAYRQMGYEVKAVKIIGLESDIIHFGSDEIVLSTKDFHAYSTPARFWFYLRIPFLLRKIIKKYKIDYTLSYGDMANVFSAVSFTNEYKVAGIHALKSVEFTAPSFLNKVFRKSFQTIYRRFQKVVCISEAIKKDLIENCDYRFPENLQVIYNPHDIIKIQNQMVMELDNEKERTLFQNRTIVFIGRMSVQKAPWHLLKSFVLLRQKGSFEDVKLVFIGDGNESVVAKCNALIQQFKCEDAVVFLGRKSNPFSYLHRASVLALSSYYEGTPNVIVEAIATNTPIVSSNCTAGIIELMAYNQPKHDEVWIRTEAGLVTPNFFKGNLAIPSNDHFTSEETAFALALEEVLNTTTSYREQLQIHQKDLLQKFDLMAVAREYINEDWQ
ncbi:MAG: hypothetical protein RLZZ500_1593 [Bacteroidota bacterium]|jgi:glycosyltransferase involved in cell wall biosynthesis